MGGKLPPNGGRLLIIYVYTYVYIYREREKERERDAICNQLIISFERFVSRCCVCHLSLMRIEFPMTSTCEPFVFVLVSIIWLYAGLVSASPYMYIVYICSLYLSSECQGDLNISWSVYMNHLYLFSVCVIWISRVTCHLSLQRPRFQLAGICKPLAFVHICRLDSRWPGFQLSDICKPFVFVLCICHLNLGCYPSSRKPMSLRNDLRELTLTLLSPERAPLRIFATACTNICPYANM